MSRLSTAWESEDPCSRVTVEILIVLGLLPALEFVALDPIILFLFTPPSRGSSTVCKLFSLVYIPHKGM